MRYVSTQMENNYQHTRAKLVFSTKVMSKLKS